MDRPTRVVSEGESGATNDSPNAAVGRRAFLTAGAAGAGVVLAGCNGLPGPLGSDGPGAYRNWVPATIQRTPTGDSERENSDLGRLIGYADLEALATVAESNPDYGAFTYSSLVSLERRAESERRFQDPLLLPTSGLFALGFAATFGGQLYLFVDPLLESRPDIKAGTPTPMPTPSGAGTPTPEIGNTTGDEWILAGRTFIVEGSVDTDAIVAAAGDRFSESGSIGAFTVYEATTDSEPAAFAVRDDTVAFALYGGRAELEPALKAKTGVRTRLYAENADVKWAFDTAGAGDVALGGFLGPQNPASSDSRLPAVLRRATFLMTSLDLERERASTTMAFVYDAGSAVPTLDELAGAVGNTTATTNISVAGNHVEITGTWEA